MTESRIQVGASQDYLNTNRITWPIIDRMSDWYWRDRTPGKWVSKPGKDKQQRL